MQQLKIVTINTWKCDGAYHERLKILARQLKELEPDLVACQECFKTAEGNADTLAYLSGTLNMHNFFLPGRFKKREFDNILVDSYSGLGILSKYPLVDFNSFDLPPVAGDDARKAQQATVSLPNSRKLLFTNTHLTHINSVGYRRQQAIALAAFVTAAKGYDYQIVCGDFNALPQSEEIHAFMSHTKAVDCYQAGNGMSPRYSLADAFDDNKFLCVDYLLALPVQGTPKHPTFVNSAVVLNKPDKLTGLYPSDHFGVCTTLIID